MNYAAVTVPIQTVRRISVRWWAVAAYALVIVLAYGVRAATFDRYLPLMDYSDESNMLLLAMDLRGTDEVALAEAYGTPLIGEWLAGYPPLYPWMNVWTQRLTEQYTDYFLFPGDYIYWLRVVSVAGAVLTVVLMLPLGYALARPLGGHAALFAGLLAAIPWAIAPVVVEIGTLAIPDSFIYPACVLALLGGVLAIQQDRGGWLVVSLLGGIAGIYLKYSLIFALIPAGGGAAVLLYKRVMSANTRGARRRGFLSLLPWFIIMAVLSAYTASFLVFQHGALGLENQEAEWFRENGWANMFSVGRNFHNARLAVWAVMNPFVWVVGIVLGGIGWVYSRRRRLLRMITSWLWLMVPYTLGN